MRRRSIRRLVAVTVTTAVGVGLSAALGVAGAGPANAAPLLCLGGASDIYTPPASVTAPNGSLLQCRGVTLSQVPGNIPMSAEQVQYASTDAGGKRVAVSGTVAVPNAAWTGSGPRPIVAFNPGTLGIGPQCAFSKQLAGAYQDEYEGDQIAAFLKAGFAVAATDGIGYLDGQTHPYVVGADAGHALLDIAKTASQVPFSGLSASSPVVIDGYSEGGQASLWAAQLAHSYAPTLKVVGAAAGGVPGQLKPVGAQLNGGPFAGFLVDAVIGVITAHPSFPINSYINDAGRAAIAKAKTTCLLATLSSFVGAHIEDYSTQHLSLDQLYKIKDPSGYSVSQFLDASTLGANLGTPGSGKKYTISFPVYQYRGAADEIINNKAEDDTAAAYCADGIRTLYKDNYIGEHLTTDGAAENDVVAYLLDRVNGKTAPTSC